MKLFHILLIVGFFFLLNIPIIDKASSLELSKIDELIWWAAQREITLQGVNKNASYFASSGFVLDSDKIKLENVPNVQSKASSLYKIPDHILEVMKGKTIYFSTQNGRSYAVANTFSQSQTLEELDRGLIIEQSNLKRSVLHELGHIIDFHGIQGKFEDKRNVFSNLINLRNELFHVDSQNDVQTKTLQKGHLTYYSVKNSNENFAEHFAFYVIYPDEFRDKMEDDPLLKAKYEFFKDYIFNGIEY